MNSKEPKTKPVAAPRLRFPGFEGEWQEKKLGKFLTESRLAGSDGAKARKITVKLWGKGVYEKQDKIQGSENTKYFKRKAGQLIYSKLDFLNGAFGIIPPELDGFESTLDLPCFDFSEGLHPNYILEYISREEFYSKFEGGALGGRKARRVTPEEFLSTTLPLPSLPEQTRIAAALSSLDAVIAAHQSKLDTLREHKRGLIAGLFPAEGERVPRLRFPEFEGAGEWEEKKLGDYIQLVSGLHLLPDQYSSAGEVPYFSGPSDFTNDIDAVRKWTSRTANTAVKSDTLITVKGSGVGEVWYLKINAVVLGRQLMAVRANGSSSDFIHQYLLLGRSRFEILGSGNLIPGLSRVNILNLKVTFPSLPEQTRIAAALSSLDDLIIAQGDKISALQEFKRGLMQGLFPTTGASEEL